MSKKYNRYGDRMKLDPYIKQLQIDKKVKRYSYNYIIPWVKKTLTEMGESKRDIENYLHHARRLGMSKYEISAHVQMVTNYNKEMIANYKRLHGKKPEGNLSTFTNTLYAKELQTKKLNLENTYSKKNVFYRMGFIGDYKENFERQTMQYKSNLIGALERLLRTRHKRVIQEVINKVNVMTTEQLYKLSIVLQDFEVFYQADSDALLMYMATVMATVDYALSEKPIVNREVPSNEKNIIMAEITEEQNKLLSKWGLL